MLKLDNLSFSYDGNRYVLKNVSGEFYSSEIISILGENGSGKSTFLKILAGVIENYSGTVFLDSENMNMLKRRERAKRIAYVPQIFSLPFPYKVEDILTMGLYPYETVFVKNRFLADRVVEIAEKFKLSDKLNIEFNKLSGGEQQRVLLARAIVQNTDIILLDEPGSFLDIRNTDLLLSVLLELRSNNKLIFIVTHDLNIASLYSDRVVLMKNGTFYDIGIPEETLTFAKIRDVFGVELYYDLYPGTKRPIVAPLRFKIGKND